MSVEIGALGKTSRTIVADSFHTLLNRILNMGLAAVLGILTARALGPANRGIYVLPAVEASFMIALMSGLSGATTYFMIKTHASRVPRAAWTCGLAFVIFGALVTFLVVLLSHQLWSGWPAILVLPSIAGTSIASGYYFGIHRVRLVNALSTATIAANLVLIGGALYFLKRDPHIAIWAWVISYALVALAVNALIAQHSRHHPPVKVQLSAFAPFAFNLGTTNLVSLLNYRIDAYLVALLMPLTQLGLYTVAVAGAESIFAITKIAATVTLPHIGSLDREASIKLTARGARNNLAIALVLCAAVWLAAPLAVTLLYGDAFAGSVPPLRLLLIGILAGSPGSILSTYFSIHLGRPYVALALTGMGAIVSIFICVLLIPRIGILGAAAATAISYWISQALAGWYFHADTGVPLRQFYLLQKEDLAMYRALAGEALHRLKATFQKAS